MTDIVIFGINGNLSRKKLIPSLFRLEEEELLPEGTLITGLGRRDQDIGELRERIRTSLESVLETFDPGKMALFLSRLRYMGWKDPHRDASLLAEYIKDDAIFYFSLPPSAFRSTADILAEAGLNREDNGFRRLVLEKPFGWNEDSAIDLNRNIHKNWDESQIFRLDHFLGKETVQNIMVSRFANMFLEPVWNRNYIKQVQITVFETQGIEDRGEFYDKVGALRDMVQNHLLQILALTAMEPPARIDPLFLRDEKVKLFRSVRPLSPDQTDLNSVRGTYSSYTEEPGIPADSRTETFAALKIFIDNWRWKGIPFYLRTGKKLPVTRTQVAVEFNIPPLSLFKPCMCGSEPFANNWMIFDIKPEQKMRLIIQAKKPGMNLEASSLSLTAPYQRDEYKPLPDYSSLLKDILEGDSSHSLRFDEINWSWHIIQPLLDAWEKDMSRPELYPDNSEGPKCQNYILEDGHQWRYI